MASNLTPSDIEALNCIESELDKLNVEPSPKVAESTVIPPQTYSISNVPHVKSDHTLNRLPLNTNQTKVITTNQQDAAKIIPENVLNVIRMSAATKSVGGQSGFKPITISGLKTPAGFAGSQRITKVIITSQPTSMSGVNQPIKTISGLNQPIKSISGLNQPIKMSPATTSRAIKIIPSNSQYQNSNVYSSAPISIINSQKQTTLSPNKQGLPMGKLILSPGNKKSLIFNDFKLSPKSKTGAGQTQVTQTIDSSILSQLRLDPSAVNTMRLDSSAIRNLKFSPQKIKREGNGDEMNTSTNQVLTIPASQANLFGGGKVQYVRVLNSSGVATSQPLTAISLANAISLSKNSTFSPISSQSTNAIPVNALPVTPITAIGPMQSLKVLPRAGGQSQRVLLPAGGSTMLPPGTIVNAAGNVVMLPIQNVAPNTIKQSVNINQSLPVEPEPPKPVPVKMIPDVRTRKPCNCTKSQCLKLYCDCFANGEFCNNCNCNNCYNNLTHEEERQRAIKSCLERNPQSFKPKIGKSSGEKRRHNKGCNCKRSGCLKNYCECYEAKIPCSAICKCVGCKNCEAGMLQNAQRFQFDRESSISNSFSYTNSGRSRFTKAQNSTEIKTEPLSTTSQRQAFSNISNDVVEATCQCLLAQAEEAERSGCAAETVESLVLEEFGRCLLQIIEYSSKTKALGPSNSALDAVH